MQRRPTVVDLPLRLADGRTRPHRRPFVVGDADEDASPNGPSCVPADTAARVLNDLGAAEALDDHTIPVWDAGRGRIEACRSVTGLLESRWRW